MASATSCPPIVPGPFDLGIHTPANLNRGARTALLQNSPAIVNGPVGVPPAFGRTAQTPSSPLNAISTAAATEGAQLAHPAPSSDPATTTEQQPVSLIEAATKLARDRAEEYNAKLKVFQAFCAKFEEATKQFTTGPEREFAQKFADSFLDSWNQALTDAKSAPAPTTYSAIAASPPAANNALAHQPRHHQQQRQQQQPPHRQGQPTISAPLRVDLRVFIRLDAEAPARAHNDYAIRAHISRKLGVDPRRIPRVLQVRSGWAVLTADITTRDLLVQRQTEWAPDLGAAAVETRQEWFTYLVSDYPRKLTDLYGNEADSDAAVEEEIEIQTGQKPVNIRPARHQPDNPLTKTLLVSFLEPVKKYWRLFSSRPARLIKKTDRPRQCNMDHIRIVGAETFRQRNVEAQRHAPDLQQNGPQQDSASSLERSSPRAPSPAASRAPSCIMVATTPEAEEEPEHPRPGSPRKRRIVLITRPHDHGHEVFQANVGKIPPVYDCALALADSERYDVVLLQEPWTTTANSRCLTKTHPAYDTYSLVEAWNSNSTRPRVMTYVRRDSKLSADQNRPYQSRDILWLTVNDTIVVNFYRQNDERDALDTLLQWPIPDRCLVAGDFNARHHTWQTGPTTNRGHEIASWASENGLGLLNTSDIPTNPHGNTIDLAFSNVPLAEANVEDHLATSSDHFTLSLTLPNVEPAPTQPGKIRVTTDDELKRFVEIVELGSTAIPVAASSPLELDKLASTLVSLLQSAAKAAGRPARKGARNAPWWTEECALAAAGYRAIRRLYPLGFTQEVQIAKRDFHRVIRRAKRLYWRNLINSFSDSSSVFKAVRWLRSPGAFQPPPLQADDVVYETQLDKANALRRATLERRTAEDDIQDPWIEVSPRKTIPFPQEISLEEAQDATLRTGNTSPGADNITVTQRPDDPASLATHLSAILSRQGTGTRSATDLVAALVHDIEEAFARKKVATLVTMDIQGAFNTVLRNRLILRLREQGWPEHLARWTGSFMDDRSACVRYQDTITPLSPLQCGLPQGSPVSPILFLLYTEPIYRLSNPQGRFGYADDTAILCVGDTVEETAAAASRSVEEMVRWGAANGVSFDPKKTEVMHFSRSKLETAPAIRHGYVEKHPEAAMRWLGIWLDSNLSFRVHAEKWTAKSQAVAYHLRGLTNTIHGPLPSAVRSAVRACVEPVLLYGTEVWYPGATRPRWDQPSKDRPSSIQHLLQRMNKAIVQSMRAILPVWKTTPTAILHRESGIPPITQLLEARRYRFSARLKSLDETHPLAKRTLPPRQPTYHQLIKRKYQAPTESSFRTRLRRTNELLAPCPRPALMQKRFGKGQDTPLQTAPKGESAEAFLQWVETVDPATWIVYSDGSLSSEGAASYGFAIHQKDLSICDGSGRLGPAEVFDAEATGALEGLKAALNLPGSAARDIVVCLDNLAAATCLRGSPPDSSQAVFVEFQALAASHGATQVRWIPGHTDIPGNEQ
ncbi:endonuclease reverse transcriptase, partial [Fusarium beomiforme]